MPYSKNSQLPDAVKDNLPARAQTIFRKAFNASYSYGEVRAFKIAWSAVKKSYRKSASGKWVKK
tara:strand:- start:130 stop:321 length:192 start_codon:yes stop_codon:yes gene_type:complete